MNYSFSVGFEILSRAQYEALSSSNRGLTRTDFLNLVQNVIDVMGTDDVTDPAAELDSRLTAASGGGQTWTRGIRTDRGACYQINTVSGDLVCSAGFELKVNGNPYVASVTVAGVSMSGAYFVSFSADNGPY